MAFGALRAVRRVGLRVPTDVSVVGFDDHPMAEYFELTTMAQDVPAQGRQIAKLLVGAVVRSGDAVPVSLGAPTRLIVRNTTSVAPSFWGGPTLPSASVPTITSNRLLSANAEARQLSSNIAATSGAVTTNRG